MPRSKHSESRLVTARACCALGAAAAHEGHHDNAYAQYRQLFSPEGDPLHPAVSYHAVGDFAAAAARAGRQAEAHGILARVLGRLGGAPSPRLAQVFARARGLVADPAEAGSHFEGALADAAGEQWPFERAQLQVDYAEWLRRRRRINDAKQLLGAALEAFRDLGARPWVQRAETELRACGGSVSVGDRRLPRLPRRQRRGPAWPG